MDLGALHPDDQSIDVNLARALELGEKRDVWLVNNLIVGRQQWIALGSATSCCLSPFIGL